MKTIFISIASLCVSAVILGQTPPSAQSFTIDAKVSNAADGTLVVTARSLRPVWQTLESVRRRYGWIVDYEDPIYPSQQITTHMDGRAILVGGVFEAHIHEPIDNSPAEQQRVLKEVVDQYNAQSSVKFSLRKVSNTRFDIAPATGSLLDKPVQIDDRTRSLREEVDEVLSSLTRTTGTTANQGGLIDNAMEQNEVSLKHTKLVPARQLLNEILDHAPVQKVWVFTYEPNGGSVGLGIQTAEKAVTDANGKNFTKLLPNPHFQPSKR